MGRKETRYSVLTLMRKNVIEMRTLRREYGQPEVLLECTEEILKQKLPGNVLEICYICLGGLMISERDHNCQELALMGLTRRGACCPAIMHL